MYTEDELLSECYYYAKETFEEFTERYSGYGKELYFRLKNEFPLIFTKLTFYKTIGSTGICIGGYSPEDSYCIFANDTKRIMIALDYYGVICVYDYINVDYETGDWDENAIENAINYIAETFNS